MKRHPPGCRAAVDAAKRIPSADRSWRTRPVHSVQRLNCRARFDASIDLLMTLKGQSVTFFTIQINLLIMELPPAEALSESHKLSPGTRNMRFVYE
jgi:hypothetical protein